ncbi:tetratricopeptide repeat-containing sulfotransferase family protein [Azospirillum picis]|uniref:Tetratricopeptide (TPR) repeat protein n=1 Tax=Azospirillum picis TaxID=488438 RepID=A0ABU0MNA8_9PROT|nr:tetratricopeptide repeat-containing sulfotransferase family protein [Azospirillum picis]MBP2301870.1 tetratricopeptide (TPR) repeat protein [Azospirillum picis]MDQ0534955.1 tetratricopeptide (TPR) repeat protein [Azospirillum picis]
MGRAYAHWNAGQADQAEMLCQRILAAWPGQADALHLLGLMAHAFGNADLAIQYLRLACQAPRAPAVFFSNLAEMCRRRGLMDEAETAARRATALDSAMLGAWNNLGIILQETGKLAESAICLERVTAGDPNSPEAHNNLANTYMRLGRLDLAKRHYDQAVSLRPDYAEAHSNLGHLLCDLGRFEQAAAEARLAIDLNPRLGDAYLNLAQAESARNRLGEALRWVSSLLGIAPAHSGALGAKANILKQLDRLEEALDAATAAVAAAPQDAGVHNVLGEVQQALGRTDEALASFEQAARLPGTVAEAAGVNGAVLLMEAGRPEEALARFDAVLAANPRNVSAWSNRADLKSFSAGDPDIARMEALLGPQGVAGFLDRMRLHFALGKAYLDGGDSDRAFLHLGEGNRMKRSVVSFDAGATAAWMASIADAFPPALFDRLAGAGAPSDRPIFVLGMPRSGTTLVEQILASHPAVVGAGELGVLQNLIAETGAYPGFVGALDEAGLAGLGDRYLAVVARRVGVGTHIVDKMPANFLYAGLIHLMLPNARIVHCRRDPVDTCLSCYTKLFAAEQQFAYDLSELGRFHRAYQELTAHWRRVLPADRFIEIEYEALVEDLDGETRRLLGALGLPWTDACLDFHRTARRVRTASLNQVRKPLYRSSVGRWRRHARHLAPLLSALGMEGGGGIQGAGGDGEPASSPLPTHVPPPAPSAAPTSAAPNSVLAKAAPAVAPQPSLDPAELEKRVLPLLREGRFEDAEALIRPHLVGGSAPLFLWRLLVQAIRPQGRLAEVRSIQQMLVEAMPGDLAGRFDLAETALLLGDFELGWREYHWRYSLPHTTRIERKIQQPRWDGRPIPGKTLLIHDEQGFGDSFQFLRLVRRAKERSGARVILEVKSECLSLAQRAVRGAARGSGQGAAQLAVPPLGCDEIITHGTLPPPHDVHCELMSLPMVTGLRLDDLPGTVPYLAPDPERVAKWRSRFAGLPRPLVALVWAGRPTHQNDANRSLSLATLAPLAVPGATFLALQKGPKAAEAQQPPAGMSLVALDGEIKDFDDTAAILALADLLVTVDSSPAHLAGALGRPAWVLLPFIPDWRWLMDREDTPWYPSLRLFRQAARGRWDEPLARVAEELRNFRGGP